MVDSKNQQSPACEKYQGTCEKHGDFESEQFTIPYSDRLLRKGCPTCSVERAAADQADKIRQKEMAESAARAADLRLKRDSGVPARYDDKTLDSYRITQDRQQLAVAACQRIVAAVLAGSECPNLIMAGKPGTGKSHLCCGIVTALYKKKTVRRIDLPDLIRAIRATWKRDSEHSEEQVLDFFGSVALLILEEVGTGSGTDDERARVFQVINRRYEALLPTVIVTNLGMKELRAEMGERVIDRLREGDRALVVFDWDSERGAA